MADVIDSVNGVISTLAGWARGSKDPIATTCREGVSTLQAAITEIQSLREKTSPLSTRLGDLSDLPKELRAELSGIEIDELESQLVTVINAYGGTADLNQVLVGLFRKFKIVQTRRFIQQKLWRMTSDGLLWSVPKRKGVYTTTEPPAPQASTLTKEDEGDFGDFGSPKTRTKVAAKVAKGGFGGDDEIPF
jgi:hypothetical protein